MSWAALALFALGFYLVRAAGPDGWLTHAAGMVLMLFAIVLAIAVAIIE